VFRPPLKVQEGCEHRCAYCIVPFTRGPERSVTLDQITRNIRDLARRGAHEVVLTGTQLGGWGADLDPPSRLSTLVDVLTSERAVHRIRLSSIEPWGVDDRLIGMLDGGRPGLCRHLHLPLQSGCDRILEIMNRPYTAGDWLSIVKKVAASGVPIGVGTDVIVGFPGETDDDFEQTRALAIEAPLTYLHVFPFSCRPGTPAAKMAGRIPDRLARQRVAALRELSLGLNRALLERLISLTLEAVIETADPRADAMMATTSEYARVLVSDATKAHGGRLAHVEPEGIRDGMLVCRLAEVIA
jgi:threonylcarbamoyladenosine tRNA methylthiotransferase MtaB